MYILHIFKLKRTIRLNGIYFPIHKLYFNKSNFLKGKIQWYILTDYFLHNFTLKILITLGFKLLCLYIPTAYLQTRCLARKFCYFPAQTPYPNIWFSQYSWNLAMSVEIRQFIIYHLSTGMFYKIAYFFT